MTLKYVDWQDKGYHLLLVEVRPQFFNLFVSRDDQSYAIYDRFTGLTLQDARKRVRFDPTLYELIPAPFPISRQRALNGETGIPAFMEPIVEQVENTLWP